MYGFRLFKFSLLMQMGLFSSLLMATDMSESALQERLNSPSVSYQLGAAEKILYTPEMSQPARTAAIETALRVLSTATYFKDRVSAAAMLIPQEAIPFEARDAAAMQLLTSAQNEEIPAGDRLKAITCLLTYKNGTPLGRKAKEALYTLLSDEVPTNRIEAAKLFLRFCSPFGMEAEIVNYYRDAIATLVTILRDPASQSLHKQVAEMLTDRFAEIPYDVRREATRALRDLKAQKAPLRASPIEVLDRPRSVAPKAAFAATP